MKASARVCPWARVAIVAATAHVPVVAIGLMWAAKARLEDV
jgi:hypothetical protein